MVAKKTAQKRDEAPIEEREGGRTGRIVAAVALYGIALLLAYVTFASPVDGTAMGAIRGVLVGLGGSCAILIPCVFAWIATLMAMSAAEKKLSAWRCAVDGVLFLCAFTAAQLFVAETVIQTRMSISGFANFVDKSYAYGSGGGAVGALLAWPLYTYLGKWGGLLATALLALLSLTATGKAGRFVRWSRERIQSAQHGHEQRRMVRDNERMFDIDEPESNRRGRQAPRRDGFAGPDARQAAYSDAEPRRRAAGGRAGSIAGEEVIREPSGRNRTGGEPSGRAGQSRMGAQDGRAAQGRAGGAQDSLLDEAPFEMAADDAPSMAPFEKKRRTKRREGFQPDTPPSVEAMRRRRGAGKEAETPYSAESASETARSRGQAEGAGESMRGRGHAEGAAEDARGRGQTEGAAEDVRGRDQAEGAGETVRGPRNLRAQAEGAAEARGPERPNGVSAQSGAEPGAWESENPPVSSARSARNERRPAKDRVEDVRVAEGDLEIEPEVCDVIEADEPPFDVPERPKKPLGKLKRPAPAPADDEEAYNYPPIDLLSESDRITENHREADMEKARLLEETLQQFGISTTLTGIAHGPAVTRFELAPAPGVKVSRITSLADDIAMHLAAMSVRIEAPIPGKAAVGVEIPNEKVEMVRLRDVLESAEARKSPSKIAVGLGKDNSGRYIVADIAKMPHVLIAGQTGSGKSVCINSIITSILYRAAPDEVRMILIDPKVVELSIYNDIPHLICPVVTDCKKAASALEWAVAEMSTRYKRFAERGVRDIKGYNKALREGEKPMPQMVIIIDELADLMMVAPGDVEDSICRLAQLARAAGMHLVIATQRPSVNVVTGIIKANIPTRIAFSVASQVDSRTMIDHGGAEKLLGNGDMLFVPSGINKPMRVQGAWVSDEEVHAVVDYIKQRSNTDYDEDMIEQMENATRSDAEKEEAAEEYDPRLPEAVEIVVEAGQASVSMLQRRMRVGYARAGRLIDEMQRRGIVSEADGAKPRTVLITREQMNELFDEE